MSAPSIRWRCGFSVCQESAGLTFSACESVQVSSRGQVCRRFLALPIGTKLECLALAIQRVFCMTCGLVRRLKAGFADDRRTYIEAFERYALDLSQNMTTQGAARHLGASWDVIKDIQKSNYQKRFPLPMLRQLKQFAFDKISIGMAHHYRTIVLELTTGVVAFEGEGRGARALIPF